MNIKPLIFFGALALLAVPAAAKLPAPSDEAKAKAAEMAARAAHADLVASYQSCKAQDRVVARYRASQKAGGQGVKFVEMPACTEPGGFVYVAATAQRPLEASGAHSPAKTATAPPGTATPAAEIPAKK